MDSTDDSLERSYSDATDEKVYKYSIYFSLLEVLKERFGLTKRHGLDLYRGLRSTLGAQNSKTWKARDMLNLLEKRANQKEYMQQVSLCEGEGGGVASYISYVFINHYLK